MMEHTNSYLFSFSHFKLSLPICQISKERKGGKDWYRWEGGIVTALHCIAVKRKGFNRARKNLDLSHTCTSKGMENQWNMSENTFTFQILTLDVCREEKIGFARQHKKTQHKIQQLIPIYISCLHVVANKQLSKTTETVRDIQRHLLTGQALQVNSSYKL